MQNRLKTIEVTKKYCDAFNRQDLDQIKSMLDGPNAIFSRQGQPTIVGAELISNRTRKLFERLQRQGHHLHMVNAIIDIKESKARPCLLGMMDGERFSVVIISCKPNGLITSIAILLNEHVLKDVRPIEPLKAKEVKSAEAMKPEEVAPIEVPAKPLPSREELEERKKGLIDKAQKLELRLSQEGPTPIIMEKLKRLEKYKRALKQMEARVSEAEKVS